MRYPLDRQTDLSVRIRALRHRAEEVMILRGVRDVSDESRRTGASNMTTYNVGYFVGSLAKASINRKLSRALLRLAPKELQLREIPFRDLPLYSYDYDADYPPAGKALKDAIAAVDAVLFVTPEYNRSIPGGLKNAIDWASRPYGTNSFTRKPSGVIGTSPGKSEQPSASNTFAASWPFATPR